MTKLRKIERNTIFLHILGCAAFMSIAVFSTPHRLGLADSLHYSAHYRNEILEYAFTVGFFYLNYFYLVPHFYLRRRYGLFILSALLGFIVVSTVPELLQHATRTQMNMPPPPFGRDMRMGPPGGFRDTKVPLTNIYWHELGPLDKIFLKYSVVFILAITLRITNQLKRIQREKADSEIMFLKAQINPHFLFNTLNSIYTLAIEAGANSTGKAIVQLSAMMRYSTTEASADVVQLSKELTYIDNYVTLQRLRINDRVKLQYTVDGNTDGKKVAPFLLIPFIENAFKYGVSTDQDSDINIKISVRNDRLSLHAINNKVYITSANQHGTSIGIANTRKRLELLYPGRHELVINDGDTRYEVIMYIDL